MRIHYYIGNVFRNILLLIVSDSVTTAVDSKQSIVDAMDGGAYYLGPVYFVITLSLLRVKMGPYIELIMGRGRGYIR